jgi:hypothetical protein
LTNPPPFPYIRFMDNDFKGMARSAEKKLTESILRWKYRKEGKSVPEDEVLERQSEQVRDEAHRILQHRTKKVWEEIKKAYRRKEGSAE